MREHSSPTISFKEGANFIINGVNMRSILYGFFGEEGGTFSIPDDESVLWSHRENGPEERKRRVESEREEE